MPGDDFTFLLARALNRLENPSTSSCLKNVLFGLSEPGLPTNFQKGTKTQNCQLHNSMHHFKNYYMENFHGWNHVTIIYY